MPQCHYTQLSYEERVIIANELKNGNTNISSIARKINRHKSTVSRELHRNGKVPDNKTTRINRPRQDARHYRDSERSERIKAAKQRYLIRAKSFNWHATYRYCARKADYVCGVRKHMAMAACHHVKIEAMPEIKDYIEDKLLFRWSPEQISLRLKVLHGGVNQISHTAIYRYIYDRKELKQYLRRRGRPMRRKQRVAFNQTNRMKHSIHDRPDVVDKLARIGDLEGDTIFGKDPKDRLLTHIDRKTGLISIGLVIGYNAHNISRQTKSDVRRVFGTAKTITYDNGAEFTLWKRTERATGADIYFADPYSPGQRGRNENANGLIRDYLPKGTDFKKLTQDDIMKIEFLLNNRPRKRLGGLTPNEAYVALKGLT